MVVNVRPRLLDLFCGAGGCSKGYADAGFDVVGVDKEKQSRYPFTFIQADALKYLAECGHCFDAIHASPPCQLFSPLRHLPNFKKNAHEDLIEPTRAALIATGKPYVIENVPGAPLIEPFTLCGTMFGLRTDCGAELRRHRLFETNWFEDLLCMPQCQHYADVVIGVHGGKARDRGEQERRARDSKRPLTVTGHTCVENTGRKRTLHVAGSNPWTGHIEKKTTISVYGDHARDTALERANSRKRSIQVVGNSPKADTTDAQGDRRTITVTGSTPQRQVETNRIRETFPVSAARTAMGIPWMSMKELSQSIPPAYTRWIGVRLIEYLEGGA